MNVSQLIEKNRGALLELAAKLKIAGRHKMNKEALVTTIAKTSGTAKKQKREKPSAKPKRKTKAQKKKAMPPKQPPVEIPVSEKTPHIEEILEKQWPAEAEQAKFDLLPASQKPAEIYQEELPRHYGETSITIMVRDPYWAYAYWEIEPEKLEKACRILKQGFPHAQLTLRVYDITNLEFTGNNAHRYFDIEITNMANNWYINLGVPDRTYCVDIGLKTTKGDFHLLARSNIVNTPRAWMSEIIDEKWMSSQEEFEKIYALSGGYRVGAGSLELQEIVAKRLQEQISSPGISSMASEVMPLKEKARKFWFKLDTELIVYGATEPDATVSMQGRHISLRSDGTFSMRFALPDGTQVIPVTAESSDGVEIQAIIPTVSRSTERPAPKIKK